MAERYQVIIVGGGPVGVGLAVELGQRGISSALVERYLTPQRIPKGQNLTNRSLEHFYFWNCADELRAARIMPAGYPIGGVTAYGNLMSEYWYTPKGQGGRGEPVRPYYFQDNERLPQYLSEEVLRRRLAELPSVTTFFGKSAQSVQQDDRGVRVLIADENSEDVLEADYVVGCDGARSTVREQLSIDRSGTDFDQKMLLAVLQSRELHKGLERFPECTTYRVLRPELQGYWQFFGRIDVGEGFFFHAPVPVDTDPATFDFQGLVHQAAGFPFECSFDHVGFWDLRIAVASRYREGRGLLAGDSCHSHPPYGGFGLNSGLEDAVNLGWKLAAVLDGWGSEHLIDSYTEERQPIFVETGEMIARGIERDRLFLNRWSPEKDGPAAFEAAWEQHREGGAAPQSYEPHNEGSSINFGPAGSSCSIQGDHSLAARAGHHLAPRGLSSGRDVFEELGANFTLIALGAADSDVRAVEQAATGLHIPLKVIRDSQAAGREAYDARLILVRPDQFVAWAAESLTVDPAALMQRAVGL